MKKILILSGLFASVLAVGCGGANGDDPGRAYMPDMQYSRAYETYGYNNVGDYERLRDSGVYYTGQPVPGTRARGDMGNYYLTNDSAGLQKARGLQNPFAASMTAERMREGERLYLIHCGICHGSKLDGNGPLYKGGNGPYPAAPRPLNADYAKNLTDGDYYHVITYGKGAMGSYASQVKPEERWWITAYIRSKQGGGSAASDTTAAAGAADTTAAAQGGSGATQTTTNSQ